MLAAPRLVAPLQYFIELVPSRLVLKFVSENMGKLSAAVCHSLECAIEWDPSGKWVGPMVGPPEEDRPPGAGDV